MTVRDGKGAEGRRKRPGGRRRRILCAVLLLVAGGTWYALSPSGLPLVSGAADPRRETVVMIHGMQRTGRSMARMAAAVEEAGYHPVVCSYRSDRPIHVTATNLFAALEPVVRLAPRVHFVTHSLGGILLRDAFREKVPANLGRVVMLGPPNHGSEHIDVFAGMPFFDFFWGVPSRELGTDAKSFPRTLPPVDFPCAVIAGDSGGLLGLFLPRPNDGKVTVSSARADGVGDVLVVHANHTFLPFDREAIRQTIAFLSTGRFE